MQVSEVVFLLAWCVIATANEESDGDVHFTNSWAVHIDNDDIAEVSNIAHKHGFVNQGQIGTLPGYYHFVKHSVRERSRRSLDEHVENLLSEPRVKWVEQQRILERSKRDVIPGEDELVQRSIERLRKDNAITIRDPFYKDQWYLQNIGQSSGPSGIDINVLPVWAKGYSGKGIVVSVLDDGVDHTHPDLKNNYDPDASFDFNDFDGDPKPRDENLENCHGTKCAGEVAAQADNGICGVGVSFNASIGGIRMLDGKATDTLEGSSLSYRSDYIDIYSCCWGPKDDGKRFGKPGYLASKALQIGAERVTTDLHHKCTEVFKGTSSAAPLAAGMLALVLEANPKLTWRDVQHLIVETSQITSPLDEGWKINGAGKRYNRKFGFGRLDVSKMVIKALSWKKIDRQRLCHGATHTTTRFIPASGSLALSANTSACSSTSSEIRKLEHVQINVTLRHRHRGDLSITLISPSGTRSKLLATRRNDHSARGLKNWVFMTVHCWGEDPRGLWTLIVTDNDNNNRKHYVEKLAKGDEEDVTRIFLDSTGKHGRESDSHISSRKRHQKDHVLKTMEDTEGKLFNGDEFKTFIHRKKAHSSHSKPLAATTKKTEAVRHRFVKKKFGNLTHVKKDWKSKKSGKAKVWRGQEILSTLKRKNIETKPHLRKEHRIKKSKKNHRSSKNFTSKTALEIKSKEMGLNIENDDKIRKKMLKFQLPPDYKLNTTFAEETLKKLSSSVLKNKNASDDAKAFDLINKLIAQIEGNPLVSKIAREALKNPDIGRLFGIGSSLDGTGKGEKNVSSSKSPKHVKKMKKELALFSSSLIMSGQTSKQKEKSNRIAGDIKSEHNGTGVTDTLTQPKRVDSSGLRHIQFFKILREASHRDDANGESGDDMNSGSADSVGQNETETFMSSLDMNEPAVNSTMEFQGEGDFLGGGERDTKEKESGDGEGGHFLEHMKEEVEAAKGGDDLVPLFDYDVNNLIEDKPAKSVCNNFSQDANNQSIISSKVHCQEFLTKADENEKEDRSLVHYLAINKLKTASVDNDLDDREDLEDRTSSLNVVEDKDFGSDRDFTEPKYHGTDLEVLQEALEEQLSRLSKDPNSTRANAGILARVKDDISRGDIDDLELLESQITGEKTDFSRVVRSVSLEEQQMSFLEKGDYAASPTPQMLYAELDNENEELEPRGTLHQVDKQKPPQGYYVNADKYGKDNSGILESWTLILYGTK
ncbi:uncharacterized protein [Montipora foliosa]|uniref:uncharacterized protein isoform X2 n=1 Tax=Montipora foliosa TaxID=591990 RepID=UPI0035F106D3